MRFSLVIASVFLTGASVLAFPALARDKVAFPSTASSAVPVKPAKAASAPAVVLVDINASSVEILKSLPGIGDAEAERIVAGRPYRTKAELVTKNVLPQGTYLSIKQAITVELKPKKRTDVHRAKP